MLSRFDMRRISDVLENIEGHGVQHAIQAGIDRANQSCPKTSHMIAKWKIMPIPFSYQVLILASPANWNESG